MPADFSFRHATNLFRRSPGYALLVVLTLSLGIGASTAVFSVVYDKLISPLPYPEANRLTQLFESVTPNDEARLDQVSPANFLDWQKQNSTFEAIGASSGFTYNLTGTRRPQRLNGAAVSASYFQVLGIAPAIGRTFLADEDRSGAAHVVVISDRLWRSRLAGDPAICGKAISLNGEPYTVVGVMPSEWSRNRDEEFQLWVPLQQQVRPDRMLWRNIRFLTIFGRLKRGVSLAQARADLNRISNNIKQAYTGNDVDAGVVIMPFREAIVRDDEAGLFVCLGIVGIVLLIACANVTNLMLVRVDGRARELAIRMALGASKGRIVSQLLMESVSLAVAAGICGVALAVAGQRFLTSMLPAHARDFRPVQLSWPMLSFALSISIGTGIIFGLAPAIAATRPVLQDILRRATSRSSGDRTAKRWRDAVASMEIAMAVVLVIATGLLIRSLVGLRDVPIGFRSNQLVAVSVALPRIKYQQDLQVVDFAEKAEQKLRAIPGIVDVARVDHLPLDGTNFTTTFSLGDRAENEKNYPVAEVRLVNSRYFAVLAIPILRGRGVADLDQTTSQPVAVVSEAMAQRYWPGEDPVGKYIEPTRADVQGTPTKHLVVGVVGDVRDLVNEEPRPTLYIPFSQMSFPTMRFIVRTAEPPGVLTKPLEDAIQSLDSDQPIAGIYPMDNLVADSTEPWRYALSLLGALALLSILLTVVGIFAVISYLVRARWKEIGIRIAIGASPSQVLRSILANGAAVASTGIAMGLMAAFVLTRFFGSLIYGIGPNDPVTFLAAASGSFALVLMASYVPARRASRVDPCAALRED